MLEPMELINNAAVIKVIGIGGGGSNAVEHMVREHIDGVDFFAVNTDVQALQKISVEKTIQIGSNITKGLGAGSNPEIGKNSAEEDQETLKKTLEGADMVFIAAGMGGGTGTGASPVVAEIAKNLGILSVAVVTKPFSFEGKKRMTFADQGISELSKYVDSLIIIPNDKLLSVLDRKISLLDAFGTANDVLKGAVQGISGLITRPGLMNVDFADIRTVMLEMGYAMIGSGVAYGENRSEEASAMAISSPLLEDIDISGARGVLVNISSGFDLRLDEFEIVGNAIRKFSSENATVVIGTSLDPDMNDELHVTVVATGIDIEKQLESLPTSRITKEIFPIIDNNYYLRTHNISSFSKGNNKSDLTNFNEKNSQSNSNSELDYLDIPAFLRKKAE